MTIYCIINYYTRTETHTLTHHYYEVYYCWFIANDIKQKLLSILIKSQRSILHYNNYITKIIYDENVTGMIVCNYTTSIIQ